MRQGTAPSFAACTWPDPARVEAMRKDAVALDGVVRRLLIG
jgi:hypothetical protein